MMSIIKPDSWIPIQKKDALDMHWDIYANVCESIGQVT